MQNRIFAKDILSFNELYSSSISPVVAFERLHDRVYNCHACELYKTRTQPVFGYGNPFSRVMVIGEAPGANEDRFGKPFIGNAGKYFTKMLVKYGVDRDRDFFITNVVKCRPPGNADPTSVQIKSCSVYLEEQINIMKPQLFLALGRFSGAYLAGFSISTSLKAMRNSVKLSKYGGRLIVTFHPSAILQSRGESIRMYREKVFEEDIKSFAMAIKEIKNAAGTDV